jgi:hypothetical protein
MWSPFFGMKGRADLLAQARRFFDGGFYDHALLDIWNAAVSNLRRRVEAYGVDISSRLSKNAVRCQDKERMKDHA